ncbi:MAG: KEOPS complex kinase/ATPase Bud32 [Candidatus Pacearchaeota archaeon]
MEEKVIARGAEAVIIKKSKTVIKDRIEKTYRHPILDEKIRKLRTRAEARLLEKANNLINVPKVLKVDEQKKTIELEFISGKKLADIFDKQKEYISICKQIGKALAKLHDNNIIHGDLTTSNLLLKEKKVYFIDFGLGFQSHKVEDKAVDLHLIKQAFEARHPSIHISAYQAILQGYKSSINANKVLKHLEAVEKRGRYKAQY